MFKVVSKCFSAVRINRQNSLFPGNMSKADFLFWKYFKERNIWRSSLTKSDQFVIFHPIEANISPLTFHILHFIFCCNLKKCPQVRYGSNDAFFYDSLKDFDTGFTRYMTNFEMWSPVYTNPMNVHCIWPSIDGATFTTARDIWLLKSICVVVHDYSRSVVCFLCIRNEWIWTPDLVTRQFRYGDTAVMVRLNWCIDRNTLLELLNVLFNCSYFNLCTLDGIDYPFILLQY